MKYVYQHLKPCGEIFYIGIGSKDRPYSKMGRNVHWWNVVNKYGYKIEILYSNISWDEAVKIEKELILKYGRVNLKTGSLVNMTDGGEGTQGIIFTEEHKRKLTESQIGSKNHRFGKTGVNKGKLRGAHPASKKVICLKTLKEWDCVRDCTEELGLSYESLIKKLNGNRKNDTTLIYKKNKK